MRRQRRYTQQDKDSFYAVLDRTANIAYAAKELGLKNSTAHSWAAVGRQERARRLKDEGHPCFSLVATPHGRRLPTRSRPAKHDRASVSRLGN